MCINGSVYIIKMFQPFLQLRMLNTYIKVKLNQQLQNNIDIVKKRCHLITCPGEHEPCDYIKI